MQEEIWATYRKHGLRIDIEANKKIVQFLDVELNLNNRTHKPFIKQNDTPSYVNVRSKHQRAISKNTLEKCQK